MIPLQDLVQSQMEDRTREAELFHRRRIAATARSAVDAVSVTGRHLSKARTAQPRRTDSPHLRTARVKWFLRHYLEMVVAMVAGMVALGPAWSWVFESLQVTGFFSRPDMAALVMATNMTIAMSALMRYRGHSWRPITEMAAAMYLPFAVLFVPLWMGFISGGTLMVAGHVLMLPAMALAMLLRSDEYTHDHCAHKQAGQVPVCALPSY